MSHLYKVEITVRVSGHERKDEEEAVFLMGELADLTSLLRHVPLVRMFTCAALRVHPLTNYDFPDYPPDELPPADPSSEAAPA